MAGHLRADLHWRIGHHVHLAVLQGTEVLFLERLSAPESVVNYSRTAGRVSTHASSAGLVLLAHADPILQDAVLDGDLVAFTDQAPPTRIDSARSWPISAPAAASCVPVSSIRTPPASPSR